MAKLSVFLVITAAVMAGDLAASLVKTTVRRYWDLWVMIRWRKQNPKKEG